MRIIVLIKQVPETDALALDPATGRVVRSAESAIVNPLDLYALEAALRIKDHEKSVRIAALSMGPPQAEAALREALAMGCDEAFLVTSREFGGSDTWSTGKTLSSAIRCVGPFDFIFAGEKATDGETGQVGPEVAAFLNLPVCTFVGRAELQKDAGNREDNSLAVERILEDSVQVLECDAPALLTFCKAIGEPRLPELAGKRRAREAAIKRFGFAELDLAAEEAGVKGSPTRVVRVDTPSLTRKGVYIDATCEAGLNLACGKVVDLLVDKGLIALKGKTTKSKEQEHRS